MELLYVWVESYRNIRKQGFNFSPNYDFEVKEEKNGEYILIDNYEEAKKMGDFKYQPKNFFGDNISNITAIVGKNGSGKSTLLWFIFRKILSTKNRAQFDKIDADLILVLKEPAINGQVLVYSSEIIHVKIEIQGCKKNKYNSDTRDNFTHIPSDDINKFINFNTLFFTPIFKKQNDWKENLNNISLYKVYENNKTEAEINVNNIKFISYYLNNNFDFKTIKVPQKVKIDVIGNELAISITNIISKYYSSTKFVEKNKRELGSLNKIDNCIELMDGIIKFYKDSPYNLKHEFKHEMKNIYLRKLSSTLTVDKYMDEKLLNYAINMRLILTKYYEKIGKEHSLSDSNIVDFIELYNYTVLSTDDTRSTGELANEWLKFKYFPELSTGEEHILSLYGAFYNYFKNRIQGDYVVLFDEPDIFIHPEWQRKMLNSLCEFFNKVLNLGGEIRIQIVLSSHSPFVASDLPKENINMLDVYDEKDKEVINGKQNVGNCKVVKNKNIKTFGANIFDLYTEAFFVESSFGEFAKEKIKEVVKDLTLNEKGEYDDLTKERIKEIEYIIDSIGEKLVSTKLEKLYEEYRNNKSSVEYKKEQLKMLQEKLGLSNEQMISIIKTGDLND